MIYFIDDRPGGGCGGCLFFILFGWFILAAKLVFHIVTLGIFRRR